MPLSITKRELIVEFLTISRQVISLFDFVSLLLSQGLLFVGKISLALQNAVEARVNIVSLGHSSLVVPLNALDSLKIAETSLGQLEDSFLDLLDAWREVAHFATSFKDGLDVRNSEPWARQI